MKPASKKLFPLALPQKAVHLTAVCAVAATLTACGGSSGGNGDMSGGSGDPTDDIADQQNALTTDTDMDGLFDGEEAQLGTDPTLVDSDFDGTDDPDEDFDGDGISNLAELESGTDPLVNNNDGTIIPVDNPDDTTPEPDTCDDPDSANESWNDNCQLRRYGTYASSSYVQGVQRILWCQGYGGDDSIGVYSDGILGRGTDQSIRDFQTDNSLAVDGIVGRETWGALFSKINAIAGDDVQFDGTSYARWSITGCDANTVQFYQETNGIELLGWKMAVTPGGSPVDFSSGPRHQ